MPAAGGWDVAGMTQDRCYKIPCPEKVTDQVKTPRCRGGGELPGQRSGVEEGNCCRNVRREPDSWSQPIAPGAPAFLKVVMRCDLGTPLLLFRSK